jgi:23S rRNA pseudouridine2605 synthase
MKSVRLNKFLASSGVASRRKADSMIGEGRISLNGKVVTELGMLVDPRVDRVEVDGRKIRGPEAPEYLIVNKPVGYITTVSDPQGRPTVLDLVTERRNRLYPVGRLDADTSGLLFLMNDGKLAFRLTHPKYEVEKTYRALLDSELTPDEAERLSRGVVLEDGPTAPAKVRRAGSGKPVVTITIHEGRNRQVRRMFEAVGRRVLELARVSFGPIRIEGLKPGEWREMTADEVRALRKLVGLSR